MALLKLKIAPDKNGYSATPGTQVVETDLAGGAPRQRQDVIGAWARVPVQWTIGPEGYEYLNAFYSLTGERAQPFLADLIMEAAALDERICLFVAGSFGLASHRGQEYVVKATLAVKPTPMTVAAATAIVETYASGVAPGGALGDGGNY